MGITLKERFRRRDTAFQKSTGKILELMPNVLGGILDFLKVSEVEGAEVRWEEVMFLPDTSPPLVLLMTIISYLPGSKFALPSGEIVEITENTTDYFRRLLRFGIPLNLVEEASREEITAFLVQTAEEAEAEEEMMEPMTPKVDAKANTATDGFDLDELSEEQRKALLMFNNRVMEG